MHVRHPDILGPGLTPARLGAAPTLAEVEAMCEKLLANTVIENYAIELNA